MMTNTKQELSEDLFAILTSAMDAEEYGDLFYLTEEEQTILRKAKITFSGEWVNPKGIISQIKRYFNQKQKEKDKDKKKRLSPDG